MYIENNSEIERLARIAFPSYHGKKYEVLAFRGPINLNSYWDGGSRDTYVFVNLGNMQTSGIEQNGTMQDGKNYMCSELPFNVALIQHTVSCGKDMGITIYFHPDNMTKLLPPAITLSRSEEIVLVATRSYKNTYAGRKENRFHEANYYTGISHNDWNMAVELCKLKGLLNKAGAITVNGLNAIGRKSIYAFNLTSEQKTIE